MKLDLNLGQCRVGASRVANPRRAVISRCERTLALAHPAFTLRGLREVGSQLGTVSVGRRGLQTLDER